MKQPTKLVMFSQMFQHSTEKSLSQSLQVSAFQHAASFLGSGKRKSMLGDGGMHNGPTQYLYSVCVCKNHIYIYII